MHFELSGKLIKVEKIQQISSNFYKREFVVEVENPQNKEWNDFIKFQLTQDRCDLIEPYKPNDSIKVFFNIRGRKWKKDDVTTYFTNLEAWRIQKTDVKTESYSENISETPEVTEPDIFPEFHDESGADDLPF